MPMAHRLIVRKRHMDKPDRGIQALQHDKKERDPETALRQITSAYAKQS